MSTAIKLLVDADAGLLHSMFLELPKPETGQMRRDRFLGPLGVGHRGQEVKRFDDPPPDDEQFRYRLSYLKRSDHDAGWVTHFVTLIFKGLPSHGVPALLHDVSCSTNPHRTQTGTPHSWVAAAPRCVFTHPRMRRALEDRFAGVLAAYPRSEVQLGK